MKLKRLIVKIEQFFYGPIPFAIKRGVNIGKHCHLCGHPNWGSEPWLVTLGEHVEISGGVSFITHDGSTWVFRDQERFKDVKRFGKIHIKDNCFIGNLSIILPNVTIGPNSIVGAGSVVTKDVPEGCVYAGVPAHFICRTEEFAEKCLSQNLTYDKELYKIDKRAAISQMLK